MNSWISLMITAALGFLAASCDAGPPENTTISSTRVRTEPYTAIPAGAVPRGTGEEIAQLAPPGPAISQALLTRGRERYDAFCAPCHGYAGYGDGVVVQRGFPAPPSFHSAQQQALPRARIVEVITNGFGVMYPFADRMPPRDRWAIASYVKALQLSQSFPIDRLPDDLRSQVKP